MKHKTNFLRVFEIRLGHKYDIPVETLKLSNGHPDKISNHVCKMEGMVWSFYDESTVNLLRNRGTSGYRSFGGGLSRSFGGTHDNGRTIPLGGEVSIARFAHLSVGVVVLT